MRTIFNHIFRVLVETTHSRTHSIALLFIVTFLLTGFIILDDYGANIDSQKNFHEGRVNLDYVLAGEIEQQDLRWQMHGAFFFMLADASRRILSLKLGLFDQVSGRHAVLPILSAFFLYCLYLFVKGHWGPSLGLITMASFITYPGFFGHTFNNLKDVPLLIFFSVSIFLFASWRVSRRVGRLYGFFISWGLALSVKSYALFVPVIVVSWLILSPQREDSGGPGSKPGNLLLHLMAGILVTAAIVLLLYAPGFWGIEEKLEFLRFWHDQAKMVALGGQRQWNLIPFSQVFYKTPLPMLFFSILGFVSVLLEYRRKTVNVLLPIWVLIPMLIPCLPNVLLYHDGLRLFLVFLVPFSILSVLGISQLSRMLSKYSRTRERIWTAFLGFLLIASNLWGVISTHPYQITFFNSLAGGLKGAQEKGIEDALDYWLSCYKEAGRWLDRHAAKNAKVLVLYQSGTHPMFNTDLMRYSVRRDDLSITRVPLLPTLHGRPLTLANTYVVVVPKRYLQSARDLLNKSKEYRRVFSITRQGGEICSIYYRP